MTDAEKQAATVYPVEARDLTIKGLISQEISEEERVTGYDRWASSYDEELDKPGYVPPMKSVEVMTSLFEARDVKIFDGGCGSGIMAKALHQAGFTNIDGLDPSKGMLEACAKKNIYTRLLCDFLGTNRLDVEDNTYDAVLLVGCLIPAHVTADCFPELIRITKPGGKIIMLTRERYLLDDPQLRLLEPNIRELEAKSKWRLIRRAIIEHYYKQDSGILLVCEVL